MYLKKYISKECRQTELKLKIMYLCAPETKVQEINPHISDTHKDFSHDRNTKL